MSSNSIPETSISLPQSFTIEEINASPCKDAFTAFKQNLLSSSEALQLIQQYEMRCGIDMRREQSALTLTISRARVFGDVGTVPYPVGIKGPRTGTTILVYDRDFLLQFMGICKDVPALYYARDTDPRVPRENRRTASSVGGAGRSRRAKEGTTKEYFQKTQPPKTPLASSFAPIVIFDQSAQRWLIRPHRTPIDPESDEALIRAVTSLLNKVVAATCDSISTQLASWANKSKNETDAHSMHLVLRMMWAKAIEEPFWSQVHARLFQKMEEHISVEIIEARIKGPDGKPVTGGQLFRRHLVARSQVAFEAFLGTGDPGASKMLVFSQLSHHDKLFAASRRRTSLMSLIAEFYNYHMLPERMAHQTIHSLLLTRYSDSTLQEARLEAACTLLSAVGAMLDTTPINRSQVDIHAAGVILNTHINRSWGDIYAARLKRLTVDEGISQRCRFKIQEVVEMRERNWLPRPIKVIPEMSPSIQYSKGNKQKVKKTDLNPTHLQGGEGASAVGGGRGHGRSSSIQVARGNPERSESKGKNAWTGKRKL